MLALFTLTVLVSATLLFLVQPMFARMVLPLLGGSPAVWNTALVFYQVTLLAGYAYAHFLTGRLGARRQAIIHLVIVLGALATLPIAVPRGWSPPTEHDPVGWMLAVLAVGVGLPFFVVSTTGPLIQKWFAAGSHRSAKDPYFLYAASNAGSMIGLLSYPLLIEPALRLPQQSAVWTAGYAALVALVAACAVATWRSARRSAAARPEPETEPPTTRRRLRWVLLAFIPSSLMIGVTTHITTDVAAIPLLWVLPLALYLLSFVIVFARRQIIPHAVAIRAMPIVLVPILLVMEVHAANPLKLIVALHLLLLFVVALVCHGELARDRPPAARLTEFYLWLAIGGALGGIFNALIAPVAFRSVIEYPIAIVLACWALPPRRPLVASRRARDLDIVLPVLVGAFILLVFTLFENNGLPFGGHAVILLFALLAFPLYAFSARPLRFALAIAAILIVDPGGLAARGRLLHQERTFFGVHRVIMDGSRHFHDLIHGTTLHGLQRWVPRRCREPLGYYHAQGPAGDVFHALERGDWRVAIAGLGTGELAAYALPGQRWTFYEIDPAVKRIASDTSYFCYLAAMPTPGRVVLGDARRSIAAAPDVFDLMVLDAYTSDVIPVHLVTREAMQLYLEHLSEHGVLAFHLSNRYFELESIVVRLAEDAGLSYRIRFHNVPRDVQNREQLWPSIWMIVARADHDFGPLATDSTWIAPQLRSGLKVWTDDYSSLWSVMR